MRWATGCANAEEKKNPGLQGAGAARAEVRGQVARSIGADAQESCAQPNSPGMSELFEGAELCANVPCVRRKAEGQYAAFGHAAAPPSTNATSFSVVFAVQTVSVRVLGWRNVSWHMSALAFGNTCVRAGFGGHQSLRTIVELAYISH